MVFRNILHTAGTRILNAVFNLAALIMITHIAGSEGLGIISLIVLDITVIQLAVGLLAGPGLIYFASRNKTFPLLLTAYLWIALVTLLTFLIGWLLLRLFPVVFNDIVPAGYAIHILILGWLNGFMQIHYNLLIGQKRVDSYNLIFTLQITFFLLLFAWLLLGEKWYGPASYVTGLYASWGLAGLLGLYQIIKKTKTFSVKGWRKTAGEVLHYGLSTQSAAILHIGNKRAGFYFLRFFAGLSPLGIYSAGVQLTEGLRLIGQSISLVQYSAISNSRNNEYSRQLSIRLMKFTVLLTFVALLFLFLIPENIYELAFSKDFTVVKGIVVILSPGVLALAANTIFSHYFSGTGQPVVNLHANITGFVVMLLFAFLLIPPFGYIGAAATASVTYLSTAVYQYFIFRKQTQTRLKEWMYRKNDLKLFLETLRTSLKSNRPER